MTAITTLEHSIIRSWTRRAWLQGATSSVASSMALGVFVPSHHDGRMRLPASSARVSAETVTRVASQTVRVDPTPLYALGQRAVDAASSVGASYADARITRVVQHRYDMSTSGTLWYDDELLGVGVRVLVNGAWGFAASPLWDAEEVVRLATDAVDQAKANALGMNRLVDLGHIPVATGTWETPIVTDPFTVPIEEKLDHIVYWKACAQQAGLPFKDDGSQSGLNFVRQERILVTSEGTHVMQTRYETSGSMRLQQEQGRETYVRGLEVAGTGWEMFQDAKVVAQFPTLLEQIRQDPELRMRNVQVGRLTVVCDGATMAAMLDATIGVATQLDRALGYEANAGGTSYLDDPLAMVGQFKLASPLVTVTANRSAPTQLATVKWDEEGVEPMETTLVKEGVLTDFQTTREQAAWLAPYYTRTGHPVRSNGYAAAENALSITLQHVPNFALAPAASAATIDALVADVKDGVLVKHARAICDFQGRNGLLVGGRIRVIKDGRLGDAIVNGGVYFNTLDFWKHVRAIGDVSTLDHFRVSQYDADVIDEKGAPAQRTSHTVQAVAATIENQPMIDPSSKG